MTVRIYGECTVPTATSSHVSFGPKYWSKSLANFFLVRNPSKECATHHDSQNFLCPDWEYVSTVFIFAGEILFDNTRPKAISRRDFS
jgi:hypothetical protein